VAKTKAHLVADSRWKWTVTLAFHGPDLVIDRPLRCSGSPLWLDQSTDNYPQCFQLHKRICSYFFYLHTFHGRKDLMRNRQSLHNSFQCIHVHKCICSHYFYLDTFHGRKDLLHNHQSLHNSFQCIHVHNCKSSH